jgi:hypothetical protein
MGGVGGQLHSFLNSALEEGEPTSDPGRFASRKDSDADWTEGLMASWDSLGVWEKRKISCSVLHVKTRSMKYTNQIYDRGHQLDELREPQFRRQLMQKP